MKLFVFMGTHLPEIAHCFHFLARLEQGPAPTRFYIPEGLEQGFASDDAGRLIPYDSDNRAMDWLEDCDERAFLLIDPSKSPIPQLESLAYRLGELETEPEKIITCVDSEATEGSAQLRAYLDACIYYSDITLLGNRNGASKGFPRSFSKEYERKCYPCLFLLLKGKGQPEQALEILTPGIRRISQLFDITEDEAVTDFPPLIEASCDLDLEESEVDPFRAPAESDSASTTIPDVQNWIVRNPD